MIFEMIIPTNVIVVTTVLKTISTFLNTLTPITFTKLSNVTIVENYLLMLVISKLFMKVTKILNVNLVENYLLKLIL